MELKIDRHFKGADYTIGKLYINGEYFCDTLEDTVRDLNTQLKIPGLTAIPAGTYRVNMDTVSPRFSSKAAYKFCAGKLPRLENVPHFQGILIHIGNYPRDTDGCILVGRNTVKGAVMNSTETFKSLMEKLLTDKDNITIEIA